MPVAAALALAAVALAATVAAAAVTASNGSSVSAVATISPSKLSKKSPSPIHLTVSTKITAAGVASDDPVAKEVIDFDKNGKLSTRGLPTCNPHRIESKSPDVALKECGKSVVGHGKASGLLVGREEEGNPLPPVPFDAKITVFNGVPQRGKPTLLMYAFTESPFLSAFIVPGVVSSYHKQGFGSRFEIAIPKLFGGQGALRDFNVSIGKTFRFKGKKRSLISATCPAKKKLKARVTATFASGAEATIPMTQSCKPKG